MNEDLIKYLDGELQGEALLQFEDQLQKDQELRQAYKQLKASKKISEGLIEAEIVGHITKIKSGQISENNTSQQPTIKISWWKYGLVAAACLAMVFVALNVFKTGESADTDVFASHYIKPTWPTNRGNNDNEATQLIAKYKAGNKDALEQLRHAATTDSNYYEKLYWAAEILLEEKKYAEAAAIADQLTLSATYRSRAYYIKVMHLLSQDKQKALAFIKTIPQDSLEMDEIVFFKELQDH